MRREKRQAEQEEAYFAARDRLREKRQKNSLLGGCPPPMGGSGSGGRGLAESGPRPLVISSSGDGQFNLRLQQLLALDALKGGSNG
jgi:hypothetical protein